MSDDKPQEREERLPGKTGRPSKDTLNLIVAVCAVLISAASFVATYVQSEAALQEVKAETWPFLQIDHGNVDPDTNADDIYYYLENAGVGPAYVKSFILRYEDKPVLSFPNFVRTCCLAEGEKIGATTAEGSVQVRGVTDTPSNLILPSGGQVAVFVVQSEKNSQEIWKRIDNARWKLKAKACYCSILEECFETNFVDDPIEVKVCRRDPELEYSG